MCGHAKYGCYLCLFESGSSKTVLCSLTTILASAQAILVAALLFGVPCHCIGSQRVLQASRAHTLRLTEDVFT